MYPAELNKFDISIFEQNQMPIDLRQTKQVNIFIVADVSNIQHTPELTFVGVIKNFFVEKY